MTKAKVGGTAVELSGDETPRISWQCCKARLMHYRPDVDVVRELA